jgi:DNA-binding NtrC family response regulator
MISSKYKKVAIVDDEDDIVTLYAIVLKENGYKVTGFTNPFFILEYVSKHPNEFELIVIDYRMPQMLGCELSNKISAINPNIKMLLITAYNDIKNNDLNLETVKKPITIARLLEIIKQYLS